MPTIELTLRDDQGHIIDRRSLKRYPLDWKAEVSMILKVQLRILSEMHYLILKQIYWKPPNRLFIKDKKRPNL
ncbi:MAG: hypothetical protein IPL99_08490 [Candidatus Competibacteraceae bacterium]|nr:hypothetical protein [Candidatus Competibacteraceae bacterium]